MAGIIIRAIGLSQFKDSSEYLSAGAEVYLDFEKGDNLRSTVVMKTEGRLCSAIIVCAGAASAYEEVLNCLDYHGTLVAVGTLPPASKIPLHPLSFD